MEDLKASDALVARVVHELACADCDDLLDDGVGDLLYTVDR